MNQNPEWINVPPGSKECPSQYRPLTQDECKQGATIDGETSTYWHSGNYEHWPTGCFFFVGDKRLRWSTRATPLLSTAKHLGVCRLGLEQSVDLLTVQSIECVRHAGGLDNFGLAAFGSLGAIIA